MATAKNPKAILLAIGCLLLLGLGSCDFLTRKRIDKYADRSKEAAEKWLPEQNEQDLYGYLSEDESLVIEFQFENAYRFVDGAALVVDTNSQTYLIDTEGKRCSRYFRDLDRFEEVGLAKITFDSLIEGRLIHMEMLISNQGKPISKAYPKIRYERRQEQFIADEDSTDNALKLILDRNGKRIPGAFSDLDYIRSPKMYIASFIKDYEMQSFLMSLEGDTLSKIYDHIYKNRLGKYLIFRDAGEAGERNSMGLMDTLGKEVLPAKYYDIDQYPEKKCLAATVEINKGKRQYEILDLDAKVLKAKLPQVYFPDNSPLIACQTDSKHYQFFQIVDGELQAVGQEYLLDYYVESGTRRVFLFFNQSYRNVHNDIIHFFLGRARVQVGKKFGFIDETGKVVIPIEYDKAEKYFDSKTAMCKVKKGGAEFEIDVDGKRVGE